MPASVLFHLPRITPKSPSNDLFSQAQSALCLLRLLRTRPAHALMATGGADVVLGRVVCIGVSRTILRGAAAKRVRFRGTLGRTRTATCLPAGRGWEPPRRRGTGSVRSARSSAPHPRASLRATTPDPHTDPQTQPSAFVFGTMRKPPTSSGTKSLRLRTNPGGLESRQFESKAKAAARLDLEVSAAWVSPSSRGL